MIGIEGRITLLMDSWPDWEQKLMALSKVEAVTWAAVKSTLEQLDANEFDDDIAYASGKSTVTVWELPCNPTYHTFFIFRTYKFL